MFFIGTPKMQETATEPIKKFAVTDIGKAKQIFFQYHDSAIGGHTLLKRTLKNFTKDFRWKNMSIHLKFWVSDTSSIGFCLC